jgi:diguanylate cyclase (GGDEF)-like protein
MEAGRISSRDMRLTRCDSEPIHVPGAVQGHGSLLAFEPGDGRVVYRSANAAQLLECGSDPLGRAIDDLLGAGACGQLTRAADASPVDLIPARLVLPGDLALDASAHLSDGFVIAEFEPPAPADEQRVLLHQLRRAVTRIDAARDVAETCSTFADEIRRLTGYDRVMVYHFHDDEHGEVVAEARRWDVEPYLGLHYPASDIPRPARRLLRLSPMRLIGDVDGAPVPIAGLGEVGRRPLDLSRSALRAVSPIHLQYLRNMGVGASLTISLTEGPRLWGLLACHHREAMVPSSDLRSACATVTRAFWLKLDSQRRFDEHELEQHRLSLRAHFLSTMSAVEPLAHAFVEDGHSLIDLVGADGVSVRIDGVTTNLGATPSREAIEALIESLRESHAAAPAVTAHADGQFPGLGLLPTTAAGVLAVPVAERWEEHVIWFRGEAERTLVWAGDPSKPLGGDASGLGDLSPRSSFAAWSETTRGHSATWEQSELSAALELTAALPAIRASRARDALARLALRDSLTGLPNRALLLDRIEVALADRQRGGRPIWTMFLDLDGFKEVNDSLGHAAGDQLLVEVAARLNRGVRASDTVARLGGDEFVVVCTEDATPAAMDQLAARLLVSLAAPIAVLGQMCEVTASIGIAPVDTTSTPAAALVAADAAMYRAKSLGRNRVAR